MSGTGVSVTRQGENIVLNMPNNVTFDTNSSNLKPAGANTLTGVAMVLKEYDKTAVNVTGYTDSTGARAHNIVLSQQRADNVASALTQASLPTVSALMALAPITQSRLTVLPPVKRKTAGLKSP